MSLADDVEREILVLESIKVAERTAIVTYLRERARAQGGPLAARATLFSVADEIELGAHEVAAAG